MKVEELMELRCNTRITTAELKRSALLWSNTVGVRFLCHHRSAYSRVWIIGPTCGSLSWKKQLQDFRTLHGSSDHQKPTMGPQWASLRPQNPQGREDERVRDSGGARENELMLGGVHFHEDSRQSQQSYIKTVRLKKLQLRPDSAPRTVQHDLDDNWIHKSDSDETSCQQPSMKLRARTEETLFSKSRTGGAGRGASPGTGALGPAVRVQERHLQAASCCSKQQIVSCRRESEIRPESQSFTFSAHNQNKEEELLALSSTALKRNRSGMNHTQNPADTEPHHSPKKCRTKPRPRAQIITTHRGTSF
ncbi:hypothetical protein CRENBAI_003905 [Crenichthys baileyi]|uniref:Uncharacterized protein n=1 Tax=Crenichthys baileyi TaxID=28760 RepID=A0AAV9QXR7_9TELE